MHEERLPGDCLWLSIDTYFGSGWLRMPNNHLHLFEEVVSMDGLVGIGIGAEIGEWDRKVSKASAKAQRETGRAVSVHIQGVPTLKEIAGELNEVEG